VIKQYKLLVQLYMQQISYSYDSCSSHVSAIKVQKRHCAIGQGNSTQKGTQPCPSNTSSHLFHHILGNICNVMSTMNSYCKTADIPATSVTSSQTASRPPS